MSFTHVCWHPWLVFGGPKMQAHPLHHGVHWLTFVSVQTYSKIMYIMSFRLFNSGLVALLVPPYLCSLVPSQGRAVWSRIMSESLLSYSYPNYSLRTKTAFV